MSARKWRPCMLFFTFSFQSEYTLFSSVNVKECLPRNRRDTWSLREYRADKYSQRKSIIWPVWQNGWVFVYKLNESIYTQYYMWQQQYLILLLSHIVLCLNAFAKLQNVTGACHQPDLMGNCSTCLYVLVLSVYWMACYQPVPGSVQDMRFCGHERGASWEENWHEIYAGKCTQKYSKHDKKKWWYTNSLDW